MAVGDTGKEWCRDGSSEMRFCGMVVQEASIFYLTDFSMGWLLGCWKMEPRISEVRLPR
jgi:hypothetical protein